MSEYLKQCARIRIHQLLFKLNREIEIDDYTLEQLYNLEQYLKYELKIKNKEDRRDKRNKRKLEEKMQEKFDKK